MPDGHPGVGEHCLQAASRRDEDLEAAADLGCLQPRYTVWMAVVWSAVMLTATGAPSALHPTLLPLGASASHANCLCFNSDTLKEATTTQLHPGWDNAEILGYGPA